MENYPETSRTSAAVVKLWVKGPDNAVKRWLHKRESRPF
jgi:hypothetical protein